MISAELILSPSAELAHFGPVGARAADFSLELHRPISRQCRPSQPPRHTGARGSAHGPDLQV